MRTCDYCQKDYNEEIQLIVIDGISERSTICSHCEYKNIIDYYDEDLIELVELLDLRLTWLNSLGQDAEEDNEVINLKKRINNLSPYLLRVAKIRSEGRPCFVHTVEFITVQEELNYENE